MACMVNLINPQINRLSWKSLCFCPTSYRSKLNAILVSDQGKYDEILLVSSKDFNLGIRAFSVKDFEAMQFWLICHCFVVFKVEI